MNNKPTNGHENGLTNKKADTEVDMNDQYDEYFVPVNEHRKYMRYFIRIYFIYLFYN